MCIFMISNDPFKTKNGPCPKSPRVGGMHSGVTLDMWNRYQKCITTHREVRFKPYFISCSQSKRVKSIQWCFCTVSVSASMSKHVRIRNMFPFLSTFQIFLNALMDAFLDALCTNYCIEMYPEKHENLFKHINYQCTLFLHLFSVSFYPIPNLPGVSRLEHIWYDVVGQINGDLMDWTLNYRIFRFDRYK